MNDFERIQLAIKAVIERCQKANPYSMSPEISGRTALEWLLEELERQRFTGGHAADCGYHLDQYSFECTCGKTPNQQSTAGSR